MTQLELATQGIISPEMRGVAEKEGLAPEAICQGIAEGVVVIPANVNHKRLQPCGIGRGLRTKVNANIGTSSDFGDLETELEKLRVLTEVGADTVMDLSTGGDIGTMRRSIVAATGLPVGTVPIYQAGVEAIARRGA